MMNSTGQRLTDLERRVSALERKNGLPVVTTRPGLFSRVFGPSSGGGFENTIHLGDDNWQQDGQQTAIQPHTEQSPPWGMSKSVRITERLTSFEFAVKAQFGQAAAFGLVGFLIGAIMALLLEWVWYTPFLFGTITLIIALMVLVIDHRGMLHKVVNDNRPQQPQKPQELRVAITHTHPDRTTPNIDFLLLDGKISRADILLFARKVTAGKSLAIHGWSGVGEWSRPKMDNFLTELMTMGYVLPARGNQARSLNPKGEALFRTLAEWKE